MYAKRFSAPHPHILAIYLPYNGISPTKTMLNGPLIHCLI